MIWSYVDSDVGGLIWQGLLAADAVLWLSCRAFYENMDKILIFRSLSRRRCRVFEGTLRAQVVPLQWGLCHPWFLPKLP